MAGNIRVFDESGRTYLELSGVAFTLLERVDPADEKSPANLVIAANFTADPLEDPLNFWGDYFGDPIRTEFAPYNQVFQELLDVSETISGIEDYVSGANNSPEGLNQGYTHGFVMTFENAGARDAYISHPDHERAKAVILPHIESVLIFDFEV